MVPFIIIVIRGVTNCLSNFYEFLCLKFYYFLHFIISVILERKKIVLKWMSLYIFNTTLIFFLPTLPSINTQTFLSHNFQCNFKFFFFLDSLVKVLYLMIISFHSLIYMQLAKSTLILKRGEYYISQLKTFWNSSR